MTFCAPTPSIKVSCRAGVQLTQALEGVRDALTPRPGGEVYWCGAVAEDGFVLWVDVVRPSSILGCVFDFGPA